LVKAFPATDVETQKASWARQGLACPTGLITVVTPDFSPAAKYLAMTSSGQAGKQAGPNAGDAQKVYDGGVQPTALRQFSGND
jgi:hypothetical protein